MKILSTLAWALLAVGAFVPGVGLAQDLPPGVDLASKGDRSEDGTGRLIPPRNHPERESESETKRSSATESPSLDESGLPLAPASKRAWWDVTPRSEGEFPEDDGAFDLKAKLVDAVSSLWTRERLTGEWGGWRARLEESGLTFEAALIHDTSRVLGGGLERRNAFRGLVDLCVSVDLDALVGLPGALVYAQYTYQGGRNGGQYSGDAQGYSNIDEDGLNQPYEFWYEQTLLDGRVRIKLGKVDANSEFAHTHNGAEFSSSSMGVSPTIFVLPTYPDPAFSANLFLQPIDALSLGVGFYDGSGANGVPTGRRGLRTVDREGGDYFVIAEIGLHWTIEGLAGRLALGGWLHTGEFDCFDGDVQDNTGGGYVVLDHALLRENPEVEGDLQGLGCFMQFGWADKRISEIDLHLGGGLVYAGLFPTRDYDVLGVGVTWVQFSNEVEAGFTEKSETAIEGFYKVQISSWLALKPDLQYVVHPGGDRALRNAWLGTLRLEVVF